MYDVAITHTTHDGTEVLAVCGELDLANHTRLRDSIQELLMAGPADILVDLTETTFIDSTALGTLVGARRRAHGLQGGLAIVLGNRQVTRVFEQTGLTKVFTTYPSLADWRATLGSEHAGNP
ncbi:STAS domain-containing protein [Marmoricola sp. RAF53]|uniref:STAS domain-containing protein n=1 Tax=Marmoricola sp. RAF53 TaxID=3233059 RepID=UPI003F9EB79E